MGWRIHALPKRIITGGGGFKMIEAVRVICKFWFILQMRQQLVQVVEKNVRIRLQHAMIRMGGKKQRKKCRENRQPLRGEENCSNHCSPLPWLVGPIHTEVRSEDSVEPSGCFELFWPGFWWIPVWSSGRWSYLLGHWFFDNVPSCGTFQITGRWEKTAFWNVETISPKPVQTADNIFFFTLQVDSTSDFLLATAASRLFMCLCHRWDKAKSIIICGSCTHM